MLFNYYLAGMTFQKERSAGFLANHMARLFANGLQQRIRPLGLAPAQFMTLLALWDEDGLTQRELVQRLNVEQATMANTLIRMPADWRAAIEAAKASSFLKGALGEDLHRTFVAIKQSEYLRVARTVSELDYHLYLHEV